MDDVVDDWTVELLIKAANHNKLLIYFSFYIMKCVGMGNRSFLDIFNFDLEYCMLNCQCWTEKERRPTKVYLIKGCYAF